MLAWDMCWTNKKKYNTEEKNKSIYAWIRVNQTVQNKYNEKLNNEMNET